MKKEIYKILLVVYAIANTFLMSGCVIPIALTENQISDIGDNLGINSDTVNNFIQNLESESSGSEYEGKFSIDVYIDEEREEVLVEQNEDSFTYGNTQIGYLALPNSYEKSENDYTYENSTTSISINGFPLGSDTLEGWVSFIAESLKQKGYQDYLCTINEEDARIEIYPADKMFWVIDFKLENERVYYTNIVIVSDTKPANEDIENILKNRTFNKE